MPIQGEDPLHAGGCPDYAATATATVVSGFVVGAVISDGGRGYTRPPRVRIIGDGIGAEAVAVVSAGKVVAIDILSAGFGYTGTTLVIIAPPSIGQPVLHASAYCAMRVDEGLVPGTAYQAQYLDGHTWIDWENPFTATSSSHLWYVPGNADPSLYRVALSPVPSQAQAVAEVVNGFVVGTVLTDGGWGYEQAPEVHIVGGGGENATAVATMEGGMVTGLIITHAGIGYTEPPLIFIAAPAVEALTPTAHPALRIEAAQLVRYEDYQWELASLMNGEWNPVDEPFMPTESGAVEYFEAEFGTGFFRLRHLP